MNTPTPRVENAVISLSSDTSIRRVISPAQTKKKKKNNKKQNNYNNIAQRLFRKDTTIIMNNIIIRAFGARAHTAAYGRRVFFSRGCGCVRARLSLETYATRRDERTCGLMNEPTTAVQLTRIIESYYYYYYYQCYCTACVCVAPGE